MRHRGTLFAADEAEGIVAVFVLDDDRFSLEVSGEEWAGWHVSLITLAEIGVNEYQFNLNGDQVRFVPDSRLDFAYGAVPGLAKAQEAATKTYRARRKTKKAARNSSNRQHPTIAATEPAAPPPAPVPAPARQTSPAAERVRKAPAEQAPAVAKSKRPASPPAAKSAAAPSPAPEPAATGPASQPLVEPVSVPEDTTADPFTRSAPAAAEASPTEPVTPANGELVIDLRTADQESDQPAPPKAPPTANGHHPAHAAKPEPKGGLRLLDRVRQSRAEHVHDYQVSSSGVMVRRVCSTCNHVSIGTAD